MNKELKNIKIRESFMTTRLKRKSQECHVFECQIRLNKLSSKQKEQLKMVFVESKWIYNYLLDQHEHQGLDLLGVSYKDLDTITHKDKDFNDISVETSFLKSSLKQGLIGGIKTSIKSLSTRKKNGGKTGTLKYKKEYNSINLIQLGVTHRIVGSNRIKVQGIKNTMPVSGLEQLEGYEPSSAAKLICRNGNYYIHIICYRDKQEQIKTNHIIGIDMGCKTSLVLSTGDKIDVVVEESERLKRLQRGLQHKKRGSNNYYKQRILLRKEYEYLSNIKNDKANKIVHDLLTNNDTVVIQDGQIEKWKKRNGKKIQCSILGRVKTKLMRSPKTYVLSKWIPTTRYCSCCGYKHDDIKLSDRTFECPVCGHKEDRDVHAAKNMIYFYNMRDKIGTEHTKYKPVEFDQFLERERTSKQEAVESKF